MLCIVPIIGLIECFCKLRKKDSVLSKNVVFGYSLVKVMDVQSLLFDDLNLKLD